MRTIAGAVLVLIVSVPASADPGPFDGRWAFDKQVCTNAENMGDVTPSVIANGRIEHYESACDILSVEPIGTQDSAWRVKEACSGEGETWEVESIYALDRDPNGYARQLIEIDLDEGYVIVRQNCD